MSIIKHFENKKDKIVGGLINYYELSEWWFNEFTELERQYIELHYKPLGSRPGTLTKGEILSSSQPASEFLNGLATWFTSKDDSNIAKRIYKKMEDFSVKNPKEGPGYYKGRHFTTYVSDFKELKRSGHLDEAESLLIELVKATESEDKVDGHGVAPFYYDELAKIYRSKKDNAKEVAILERFAEQKHAPGALPPILEKRLEKARALAEKVR